MAQPIMFEDIFEVLQKDPDGRKFDRVSRFVCRSELFEFDLTVDINIDVYPLKVGDKLNVSLARTIHKDGTLETGKYDETLPIVSGKPSLLDDYEYAMHGRVFRYTDEGGAGGGGGGGGGGAGSGAVKVTALASFGGLLMKLSGDPAKLRVLEVDAPVYLLMRKI